MDAVKFGEWLLAARRRRGWQQQQLALAVSRTKSYISAMERAKIHTGSGRPRLPPAALIDRLADALEIDADAGRLMMGYAPRSTSSPPTLTSSSFDTERGQALRLLAQTEQQAAEVARNMEQVRRWLEVQPLPAAGMTSAQAKSALVQRPLSPDSTATPARGREQPAEQGAAEHKKTFGDTRVITVANGCAWSGKTVTATCLAHCLAARGQTLLIDVDARADTTMGHSLNPQIASLRRVMAEEISLATAVHTIARSDRHYDVMPTGLDMLLSREETFTSEQVQRLRDALGVYRYVIVDTPSVAGPWVDLALRLATDVLVTIPSFARGLEGARGVQAQVDKIIPGGQPRPSVFGLMCRLTPLVTLRQQRRAARKVFGAGLLAAYVLEWPTNDNLMLRYAAVAAELLRRGEQAQK